MARESRIEARAVRLLEDAGYQTMKAGKGGWPDRLVLMMPGPSCLGGQAAFHVWIEFKQPGGSLTAAQKRRIPKLKERGEVVLVIDRAEEALPLVNEWHRASLNLPRRSPVGR